jgi:hypothetical protein
MRLLLSLLCLLFVPLCADAQKMLLLERANRAKTTRIYAGQSIRYRLGSDAFWYTGTIDDVYPASQSVLIDNQLIRLSDIDRLRWRRSTLAQIAGAAATTFGVTLAIANTVSLLRRNPDDHGTLYGVAAGSLGLGLWLLPPRKLKLGGKYRLRAVEIRF